MGGVVTQDLPTHKAAGMQGGSVFGLGFALFGRRFGGLAGHVFGSAALLGLAALEIGAQRLGRAFGPLVDAAPRGLASHPPFSLRRKPGYGIKCAPTKRCCRSSGVEHVLGKDGVGGSIPLGSTIYRPLILPRAAFVKASNPAAPCSTGSIESCEAHRSR